jgi:hypothetical protein
MKKGMVLLLVLIISGCSPQFAEYNQTTINATCGPFKESDFGEWINITLPKGADKAKTTQEVYRQVNSLSPKYFDYYYCRGNCELPREQLVNSIRFFDCESSEIKLRCAYDQEGWVCIDISR